MSLYESLDNFIKQIADKDVRERLRDDLAKSKDTEQWYFKNQKELNDYGKIDGVPEKYTPLDERLTKEIGDKDWSKQSDHFKQDISDKLDVDVGELDKAFKERQERLANERGIQERTEEVKNWPWYKKMLASEYAKQRYIKDPERSIFSDKGEWYNKGEDVSDLIYGGAGAIADVIPGVGGTVIGPAVRGLRDVQHKLYDSPYQKDWSDIGKDVGKDLALNVGTDYLPTALTKLGQRVARGGGFDAAAQYSKALKDSEQIGEDLTRFGYDAALDNVDKLSKMTTKDMKKEIGKVQNKNLQNALETAVERNDKGVITSVDKDKVQDVITDFWTSNKPGTVNENWNTFLYKNGEPTPMYKETMNGHSGPWIDQMMRASDASKLEKLGGKGLRTWEKTGDRAAKTLANAGLGVGVAARPSTKPKENEQVKENRWAQGYATFDEKTSPEYKEWFEKNTRIMMGLED